MNTQILLSIIIPANNEEGYIGPCLRALAVQDLTGLPPQSVEVILAANACKDRTLEEAETERTALEAAGLELVVLDIATPGKLNALNTAEAKARGRVLAYLDADVIIEPSMTAALIAALDTDSPRYASGHLSVAPARSWVTRRFAKIWQMLPFMTTNVQGAGLFAVNRAGRARWDRFPDIIADDGFVRLMFAPDERVKVDAVYHWPMVEGFGRLVHVRRRQDAGVRELAEKFPEIMANESKPPMHARDHLRLFLRAPLSYTVYVSVMVMVKAGGKSVTSWTRGR
ncbi:glycosyltransferase [Celeribacter neptunius]|uniref:Glycosyl transferase family 2 n=1 Tax=Celeribacter neptunius TaxID=588602 RepID=A0A1I3SF31_9RHOB|nr:glycosyltransferase [Celeribacter neptunius]SFJ56171.1 Glycosyl transferase family 2 [Celeribacter neptunius]